MVTPFYCCAYALFPVERPLQLLYCLWRMLLRCLITTQTKLKQLYAMEIYWMIMHK